MGLSGIAYTALARSGVPGLMRRADAAPIFCFHNVIPDAPASVPGDQSLHLQRSRFDDVVELISRRFTIVPLGELVTRLAARQRVRGVACLTFDDAYRGALRHAIPTLRQRRLPATVFIVTGAASRPRPFWWDVAGTLGIQERDRCLFELAGDADRIPATGPVLPDDYLPAGWSELRTALDDLIVPGSHTVSHRNLSALDPVALGLELRESRAVLAGALDRHIDTISYPYGFATREVAAASALEGYRAAVTLGFARAKSTHHPHALPRINIPANLGLDALDSWAGGLRLRAAPVRVSSDLRETSPSGRPP